MSFSTLGLNEAILRALTESGYDAPTAVQEKSIPVALTGQDLMVSAPTGTGKTAAFLLPSLERLQKGSEVRSKGPRILVLTPTRELATQVSQAAMAYGKYLKTRVAMLVGGVPYGRQFKMLASPVDVLVATPGRLIDLMASRRVDFSRLEVLILDEADRMLDMGFIDDVEKIAAATPANRQTLLFSATLDGQIGKLAQRLLNNPERIEAAAQKERQTHIEQKIFFADDLGHKNRLLEHFLATEKVTQAVIFTATKRDADEIAYQLKDLGHKAAPLHGDMSQAARNKTITRLRQGTVQLLVATDVAARGIDIQGISHVINFDLPRTAEDYVHRVGRTGRAGNSGIALSLVTPRERGMIRRIEHYMNTSLQAHVVEGLEPKARVRSGGDRPRSSGDRKPFNGDRKPFNGERKPFNGERKSFGSRNGEARPAAGDRAPRPERASLDSRPARGDRTGNGWQDRRPAGDNAGDNRPARKPRSTFRSW